MVPRQGRDPRLLDQRPAAIALAFLPTTANGQVAVHLNREIGNIEIDPLTAPRSIQAIIALYGQLNQAQSRHPGTDLVPRYEVKPHPRIA